jgi:phosphoribosyl 1,2-cyclic phosphate phosphodiesterase
MTRRNTRGVRGGMVLELTILGSGTSHGIPMIGCGCTVCTSPDPRDRRTRTSALLAFDGVRVLIDTPPELRFQCLAQGVRHIDALLFTHHHADHVVGLDDVRIFCRRLPAGLPVYGSAPTLAYLRGMFAYAFDDAPDYPSEKPTLVGHEVHGPFEIATRTITPVPYLHGPLEVLGFRVGDVAYCPDCSALPPAARALLTGLDVLVLDGLRRRPHPTHFNLAQAVAAATEIGARRTYFTHIAHELPHAATEAELPPGMFLAYDGLVLTSDS